MRSLADQLHKLQRDQTNGTQQKSQRQTPFVPGRIGTTTSSQVTWTIPVQTYGSVAASSQYWAAKGGQWSRDARSTGQRADNDSPHEWVRVADRPWTRRRSSGHQRTTPSRNSAATAGSGTSAANTAPSGVLRWTHGDRGSFNPGRRSSDAGKGFSSGSLVHAIATLRAVRAPNKAKGK